MATKPAVSRALALIGTLDADGNVITAYRAADICGVNRNNLYRAARLARARQAGRCPTCGQVLPNNSRKGELE